ncbi:hypothetical protein ACFQL0_18880 [Haloplanus litoreus]
MNFFPVDIEDTGDGYTVSSVHFDFQLPDRFAQKLSERDSPLGEAILGIRPEDISDAEFVDETEGYHVFDSRVKIVEPLGSDKFLTMIDPEHDPSEEPITSAGTEGEIVTQATEEFTVRVPPESTAREGNSSGSPWSSTPSTCSMRAPGRTSSRTSGSTTKRTARLHSNRTRSVTPPRTDTTEDGRRPPAHPRTSRFVTLRAP